MPVQNGRLPKWLILAQQACSSRPDLGKFQQQNRRGQIDSGGVNEIRIVAVQCKLLCNQKRNNRPLRIALIGENNAFNRDRPY